MRRPRTQGGSQDEAVCRGGWGLSTGLECPQVCTRALKMKASVVAETRKELARPEVHSPHATTLWHNTSRSPRILNLDLNVQIVTEIRIECISFNSWLDLQLLHI